MFWGFVSCTNPDNRGLDINGRQFSFSHRLVTAKCTRNPSARFRSLSNATKADTRTFCQDSFLFVNSIPWTFLAANVNWLSYLNWNPAVSWRFGSFRSFFSRLKAKTGNVWRSIFVPFASNFYFLRFIWVHEQNVVHLSLIFVVMCTSENQMIWFLRWVLYRRKVVSCLNFIVFNWFYISQILKIKLVSLSLIINHTLLHRCLG